MAHACMPENPAGSTMEHASMPEIQASAIPPAQPTSPTLLTTHPYSCTTPICTPPKSSPHPSPESTLYNPEGGVEQDAQGDKSNGSEKIQPPTSFIGKMREDSENVRDGPEDAQRGRVGVGRLQFGHPWHWRPRSLGKSKLVLMN